MPSSTALQDFVGREHELAILHAALDHASSGQGQTVVLVGEPGIGKTRTAQVFSETAVERGAAVLWGRCHQEPGAPPYWPWLQILRRFAECLDDRELRAALGSGASCIAEIYPELRERLPGLATPHSLADAGVHPGKPGDGTRLIDARIFVVSHQSERI